MTRILFIWFFMVTVQTVIGQRITAGVSTGWMFGKQSATVYDQRPLQFLYAAPFASVDNSFNPSQPAYDQVRLVSVYGVQKNLSSSWQLSGVATYRWSNDFSLQFNTGVYQEADNVYSGFQNLFVNLDVDNPPANLSSPEFEDDFITIQRTFQFNQLSFEYQLPLKTVNKLIVHAGYQFRYRLASYVTSNLLNLEEETIQDKYLAEYYNNRILQERLYSLNYNEGFNHFGIIGFGLRTYSFQMGVNCTFSLMGNAQSYYTNQQFFSVYLQYDLLSIPLFK
jgi:hypothetical protein